MINKQPMLSVFMITYNHEEYIKQAIGSILMQQIDFSIEIVVGEDCSTDGTRKILETYKKQYPDIFKLLLHETNIGAAANQILTMQACAGKYIAMLEGDDYWTDPYKLQKQVDFLESNPDYVLTFHPVLVLQKNGQIKYDHITKVPNDYENIYSLAKYGNYIHTPSVLFRHILNEIPEVFLKMPVGDYPLYMILAQYGKLKRLDDFMAVYRYGVGIFSTKSTLYNTDSILRQNVLLLSLFGKNDRINKIFMQRILDDLTVYYTNINYLLSKKVDHKNFSFRQIFSLLKEKIYKSLKNVK